MNLFGLYTGSRNFFGVSFFSIMFLVRPFYSPASPLVVQAVHTAALSTML